MIWLSYISLPRATIIHKRDINKIIIVIIIREKIVVVGKKSLDQYTKQINNKIYNCGTRQIEVYLPLIRSVKKNVKTHKRLSLVMNKSVYYTGHGKGTHNKWKYIFIEIIH